MAPHFQSFRVGNAAHAAATGRANCVNNKPDCRRGVGQIFGPVNSLQLVTPEPRRRVSSLRDDCVLFTSREERFLLSNTGECSRSIPPLALMNPSASLRAARSECVVRPRRERRRWFHSGWWWVGDRGGDSWPAARWDKKKEKLLQRPHWPLQLLRVGEVVVQFFPCCLENMVGEAAGSNSNAAKLWSKNICMLYICVLCKKEIWTPCRVCTQHKWGPMAE